MRIVSLLASSTELLCALGFENQLVGRSHECDFPESIKKLPICTEPKFQLDGTSYEIDQRLKAILAEGLSVYRVDVDQLELLAPDLIVTQAHCEVCAVSLSDVELAVKQLVKTRPRVVSLMPNSLGDVFEDIRRLAEALDCGSTGEMLIGSMQAKMDSIHDKAVFATRRPRVVVIEWISPLMSAGNWMPTLVEMAGGVPLFGQAGKHSPMLHWDALIDADPDIILVCPCGFDVARTEQEMPLLETHPGWNELTAVRNNRVFIADGNQYFNRPGPRLVESLQILAELFYPEGFYFGHEGKGWIRSASDGSPRANEPVNPASDV